MSKDIKLPVYRKWLNPKDSQDTGSVQVDSTICFYGGTDTNLYSNFEIADCSRKIYLNFNVRHKKELKEKRKKLEKLRAALDHIEQGLDEYEKILGS